MKPGTEKHVAVVYHSVAVYREAIFERLFGRESDPEFTLFAGTTSNQSSLRLLDPDRAGQPIGQGGLRWKVIRNFWIGQILIQPRILLLAFQQKWDCVIFLGNAYYLTTWISAVLCRLFGKRVLMWTHGYRSNETGRTARLKNAFFRLAHGLILYGQRGRSALMEQGFPSEKLYVAYNSLDHEKHLVLRKKYADVPSVAPELFENDQPVLVWAGRFAPGKNLPVLVKAVAALKDAGQLVNLLLLGDGPEKEIIGQLADELGISDQVRMPGAVYDQDELSRILMGCDLAISPGPVGVFAIHAQTFGLPVITCDDWKNQGPESESIMEGVTGSFFQTGNTTALKAEVIHWLNKAGGRDAIRKACYQQVDQYYNPAYQEQIINLAVAGEPA